MDLHIHNLGTGKAYMFMWHEGQASRGCHEIISCLLKFVKELPLTITHLTTFSDNAGGQNKSQYIVKFWLYVVNKTHIQTVDHKFLLSGHSYNTCDQDFGMIERARKNSSRGVYVPEDWAEIISKCNRKFIVTQMKEEDFVTLEEIQDVFVKSVIGRKMQWLHFEKENPWTLFYKQTFNKEMPFSMYNMLPKKVGRIPAELPSLSQKKETKKNQIVEVQRSVKSSDICPSYTPSILQIT